MQWSIEKRPRRPRNRPVQASPRDGAILGAPPPIVSTGAPGAREEVRAYASRILQAWEDFEKADFLPYLKAAAAEKEKSGKVLDAGTRAAVLQIRDDRVDFTAYYEKIQGFDLLGPSPSQAWQELYQHELALKTDRKLFADTAGVALKSPTPGDLEKPGGVPPNESGGTGGLVSSIPWGTIGALVALVAGAVVLSSAARIVRG